MSHRGVTVLAPLPEMILLRKYVRLQRPDPELIQPGKGAYKRLLHKKNAWTNFCQNPPDKQGISGEEANGKYT
jgi:hypothetical protein